MDYSYTADGIIKTKENAAQIQLHIEAYTVYIERGEFMGILENS